MTEFLYNPSVLDDLDWTDCQNSPSNLLSENIILRPLSADDYEKGFPRVLNQLTVVGKVSSQEFLETFRKMKSCPDIYYVTVLEDIALKKIIGSVTLFVEQKFVHECALRGRIEDLVVDDNYRGQQLGKLLVETAKRIGIHAGCYKVSLDCRDKLKPFYAQFGFRCEEGNSNFMVIRVRD